jgi:hypothetical protein
MVVYREFDEHPSKAGLDLMSRNGILIAVVAVLALAAASVFVWTNYVDVGKPSETLSLETAGPATGSQDTRWIAAMREATEAGGIAAVFSSDDIKKWQLADGHRLERFSLSDNSVFARLTSVTPPDKLSVNWSQLGLSFVLPLEFAKRTNGRTIEVGIIARSAQTNGSTALNVIYATQQAGNSGWKVVPVSGDFAMAKFEFSVPMVEEGYSNPPIIVIHSDDTGAGHSVELLGIYARQSQN